MDFKERLSDIKLYNNPPRRSSLYSRKVVVGIGSTEKGICSLTEIVSGGVDF